jgi:hypothetical protein
MHAHARLAAATVLIALAFAASSCSRMYYGAMEKFGYEKRDILINRVKDAQKSQKEAQEDFKTALQRFREVVDVDGGTLEQKYEKLDSELKRAEDRANKVKDRVDSVKKVSNDLFKEWENELGKYSDKQMRAESQRQLRDTRRRTEGLIRSMDRAEARIEPVLTPLRDRVLFLKHNLNAKALGALTKELTNVQGDVDSLVADLQQSINEADAYLKDMEKEQAGAKQ